MDEVDLAMDLGQEKVRGVHDSQVVITIYAIKYVFFFNKRYINQGSSFHLAGYFTRTHASSAISRSCPAKADFGLL